MISSSTSCFLMMAYFFLAVGDIYTCCFLLVPTVGLEPACEMWVKGVVGPYSVRLDMEKADIFLFMWKYTKKSTLQLLLGT